MTAASWGGGGWCDADVWWNIAQLLALSNMIHTTMCRCQPTPVLTDTSLKTIWRTNGEETDMGNDFHAAGSLGVGVELEQGAQVLKGIAAEAGPADRPRLLGVHHALDLVRVDEAGQVRIGHGGPGQVEA